jgi:hypothetical protein
MGFTVIHKERPFIFSTETFYGKTIFDAGAALLAQLMLKSSKIIIASFATKIISPIVQYDYPH